MVMALLKGMSSLTLITWKATVFVFQTLWLTLHFHYGEMDSLTLVCRYLRVGSVHMGIERPTWILISFYQKSILID